MALPSHIGRYQVRDEAGKGGFATVLRGWDDDLESFVAIKVLLREFADNTEIEQRFVDEARLLRRIRSPHVVTVHDVGRLEDGRPYFVMDYADRGTLAARLRGEGGVDIRRSSDFARALLSLVDSVADGLASLHAAGIVHRDIKPANILMQHALRAPTASDPTRLASAVDSQLIATDERILIGDLGIAKDLVARSDPATVVGGTPLYRAPEQEGDEAGVTPATDIYSATAMLWFVLTSEPPPTVSFVMRSIARLSHAWRVVIARGMAFEAGGRYESMDEWRAAAHEAIVTDGGGHSRPATTAAAPGDSSVASPVPGDSLCPYKGLAAYQPEDVGIFRGRETLVDEIVSRLKQQRVLAIGGPSGSGKSSVVRAGLVPALHAGALTGTQRWQVALFTPGRDPLAELHYQVAVAGQAAKSDTSAPSLDQLSARPTLARHLVATGATGQRLAIVIDQFEELYTMTPPAQREVFLAALSAMTDPADSEVRLVLVIRADFYGECARSPWLAARLSESQLLVGPMSASELRRAIAEPARDAGLALEPALLDEVLEEASGQAGALPLLSHALAETWERREQRVLTLAGYRATGGVAGALTQTAEALYAQRFDAAEREAAKRLLLRLVTPGEDTPDTRRVIARSELADDPDEATLRGVVDRLTDARLLSVDEQSLQIAHEALLHSWPRLAEWLDGSRDALRMRQRVARAAHEWETAGRDDDLLYRGTPLLAAQEWAAVHAGHLDANGRAFIDASVEAREASLRVAAQREQRARRTRRAAIALLGTLALGASAASVVAFSAYRKAQRSEQLAHQSEQVANAASDEARRQFARALGTTALGMSTSEPLLAVNLAAESIARAGDDAPSLDARDALTRARLALSGGGPTLAAAPIPAGDSLSIAMSPDGSLLASGQRDGDIHVIDTSTGERISPVLRGHAGGVEDLHFSPDMRWLASAGTDATVRLWMVSDGLLGSGRRIDTADGVVWGVRFSPAGNLLAAASQDGTVQVWKFDDGDLTEQATFRRTGDFLSVAFTPDGNALLAGTGIGSIHGWDLRSREPLFEPIRSAHTSDVWEITFDATGSRFATASSDGTTALLAFPSGQLLGKPFAAYGTTGGVSFSPSGRVLVGTGEGEVRHWQGADGDRASAPSAAGHSLGVIDLETSANGKLIATLGNDQVIRLWRNGQGIPLASAFPTASSPARSVALSGDGMVLASGDDEGQVHLFTPGSGTHGRALTGHAAAVWATAVSPDGERIASADRAGKLRTWRNTDGTVEHEVDAHASAVWWLGFSSDGERLVSAGESELHVWNAATLDRTASYTLDALGLTGGRITRAALSGDDRLVAVASTSGRVSVFDLSSAELLQTLEVDDDVIWSVSFNADGTELATAGSDEVIVLWLLATGARRKTLTGHSGGATDARYLGDNATLAAVDRRGKVHLWDTLSGRRIGTAWQGHLGASWRMALHPDGRRFATAGDDGLVKLWTVLSTRRACDIGRRAFDPARQAHYLGKDVRSAACG